ncbi:uncharacterized protein FOMMEDRAFT_144792 [Fomitiporia mediterranea MF3/22]|uniref:uncharacterized protein n=1 Tax=Fomitiporia mediterranea (strain MF3/22) TaxID=694068 RepID=UPI0004408117|nr:uncharacterized protein FOMMEDRAFT_144792 [Fomitiporia mediterranea MF3/22]EJD06972.1 hypothetical protein FOMMEDRAFT_144792 [Fomitiporia mediterranea MF3/22]
MSDSISAFFYGVLLHPKVLKRVIGNDGTHLQICPALLLDHTRHRVKGRDYPGVVPYETSRQLFNHHLSIDERSVRGNLVEGLSKRDIDLLDVFEGDEYVREKVKVYKLGALEPLNNPSPSVVSSKTNHLSSPSELGDTIETNVYIWIAPVTLLEPKLWSYEVFIRDSAWKWIGPSKDEEEYAEVDRRRAMNGIINGAAEKAIEEGVIN